MKMKPHVPAKVKDPIAKSKHKLERVPNPPKLDRSQPKQNRKK